MIDPRIGEELEHGVQHPIKTIGGRVINDVPSQRTSLGGAYFCVIDDPRPANWQDILEELRALVNKPARKAKRESQRQDEPVDDQS